MRHHNFPLCDATRATPTALASPQAILVLPTSPPKTPSRLAHARPATPKRTNCQSRTPRATLSTVPLHPTTLPHSTTTPTGACTTASASPSTASSDALGAPSTCSRQQRLVRLRFAPSHAHSAPLPCITAAHGSPCDEQLPNALPEPLSSPWPKHTCTSRPSFWLLPSQPPLSPTRQDVNPGISTRTFCAIPLPQTAHNRLGITLFRPLRQTPGGADVSCI